MPKRRSRSSPPRLDRDQAEAGTANPNGVQIVDYLKVLLRGHQAKYGKKIVPDSQLEI